MPRVKPSATPRNNEKVPSVTISGGDLRRVIITAFSAPPNSPTASVAMIANHSGMPASHQSPPITTAAKPIIEPTERSIPPVIIIGVITNASKPISTLSLVISKKLPVVRKLFPVRPKTTHSSASTISKIHSLLGKSLSCQACSILSGALTDEIEMSILSNAC